jgi:hypothetical protein
MNPKTMSCPLQSGNADVLLSYCAHMLDAERTELMEQHVAVCAECFALAEQQKRVWSALDDWAPEPISEGFDATLFARIAAEERGSAWERWMAPVRRWLSGDIGWEPVLSMGVACFTLVVGIYLQNPGRPDLTLPTVKIEAQELEQADRALEDMEMLRQLEPTAEAKEDNRL